MTAFILKLIAIIAMLLDHTAAVLVTPNTQAYIIMRSVGRIAFPIFCYFIVEGLMHTRSIGRYMLRLAAFSIISEVPFDLAFHRYAVKEGQNVFFTLLLGLIVIAFAYKAVPYIARSFGADDDLADSNYLGAALSLPLLVVACKLAHIMHTDYGWFGVALIWILYILRGNRPAALFAMIAFNSLRYGFRYDIIGDELIIHRTKAIQWYAGLAAIPLAFYNGERGKKTYKWAFYVFYPAHLLILSLLAEIL